MTDTELAIAAAEAGAAVVRSHYGGTLTRFSKSTMDFATEADIESEQAILALLRTHRPDDAVRGEETGHTGPDGSGRVWLVDPLCGTLNFAARTPLACVNVALHRAAFAPDTGTAPKTGTVPETGSAAVGASADPFAGEVFWTDGERAYLRHDGTDEPLVPAADSRIVNIDVPNIHRIRPAELMSDPGFATRFNPRILSTTLAVAWVAAGRYAAYLHEGDLRDNVHFAAGLAVCQAAGCVVTNLDGEPLHTAIEGGPGGMLLAADADTHSALLSLIRPRR